MITIIIPTYNEAQNIPKLADEILRQNLLEMHILFVDDNSPDVDDNSPDGTGKVAENLCKKYSGKISVIHRSGKLGLGTAYLEGFDKALTVGSDAIGQMDADFSHPPEKISEMVLALERCDCVIGSRYVPGGSLDEQWPIWRKGLSGFANFYARSILRLPIKDITGGFRLWKRETLAGIPLERIRANGYAFQVEMAFVTSRLGYKFDEVPIYFADRKWGDSKMSFNIQIEAAVRVWQILLEYRDLGK